MSAKRSRIEFGDFQTPAPLARRVCQFLVSRGLRPATLIEPTCGTGTFIAAAATHFETIRDIIAVEVNETYFRELGSRLAGLRATIDLRRADFFTYDWARVASSARPPILLLGNPPWVTSSRLGALESANLPRKSNFQRLEGLQAKTGKANFDIAEWITLRLLRDFSRAHAHLAFLVKSSVARRILRYAWSENLGIHDAAFFTIDASKYFGVSVDAGLLFCRLATGRSDPTCTVQPLNDHASNPRQFALRGSVLTSNPQGFDRTAHLSVAADSPNRMRWRSGVKHDCSRVLELTRRDGELVNGYGEVVDVEESVLYPLVKGSWLQRHGSLSHMLLLPQTALTQDPAALAVSAPKAWAYLNRHARDFESRRSSIYRKRPLFSVFGIGPYTFAPWKIAISGLHKRLAFWLIAPLNNRSVVFDDTVYQLSFPSRRGADLAIALLNSDLARDYFESRVFWDAKRPITAELLSGLNLLAVARELGHSDALRVLSPSPHLQLFEAESCADHSTGSSVN